MISPATSQVPPGEAFADRPREVKERNAKASLQFWCPDFREHKGLTG